MTTSTVEKLPIELYPYPQNRYPDSVFSISLAPSHKQNGQDVFGNLEVGEYQNGMDFGTGYNY